jgi:hypothetical protein
LSCCKHICTVCVLAWIWSGCWITTPGFVLNVVVRGVWRSPRVRPNNKQIISTVSFCFVKYLYFTIAEFARECTNSFTEYTQKLNAYGDMIWGDLVTSWRFLTLIKMALLKPQWRIAKNMAGPCTIFSPADPKLLNKDTKKMWKSLSCLLKLHMLRTTTFTFLVPTF